MASKIYDMAKLNYGETKRQAGVYSRAEGRRGSGGRERNGGENDGGVLRGSVEGCRMKAVTSNGKEEEEEWRESPGEMEDL